MSNPTSLFAIFLYLLAVLNSENTLLIKVEAKTNVHIVYLGGRQHGDSELVTDSHHHLLANVVGRYNLSNIDIGFENVFMNGFSGFAAKLTDIQAQQLSEMPGVVRIIPNTLHQLQTTRSWDFVGLSTQFPPNLLQKSNMGDGVIIGVLDTGIWPESKSFNDEGLGPIPSRWNGGCTSGMEFNASVNCNKKIIGAKWFIDGFLTENGQPLNTSGNREFLSARDANGHGTHVASTAGGSFVANVSLEGLAAGTARGGAPRARLAIYKVCWNVLGGQCWSADMLKAFDEAINDGVDVLSLSIGSSIPLFSDIDDRGGIATGSFHAVARGITVVFSAGNEGPMSQTMKNTAPWILTVAASTMDRAFLSTITLGNNKTILGRAMYTGMEVGFTELLYPEAIGAVGRCESLVLDGYFLAGKVVLCFTSVTRGTAVGNAVSVVKKAGGVGLIAAKHPSDLLSPCRDDFPCIEVDYDLGTRILYYIRSTRFPVVKLSPSTTVLGKPISAKVAYFSSRGPSSISPAILKPDITAPGVNILAATTTLVMPEGYAMLSGTSMSTPHVSGIVALLKVVHPDWSPAAIKSALVTTAWGNDPSSLPVLAEGSPPNVATPFDIGGGIANPNGAADPGLVYDMGTDDYIFYLCSMGYNDSGISHLTMQKTICPSPRPSILDVNVPSMTLPSLRNSTTVIRSVTNVGASNCTYKAKVEPPSGIMVTVQPDILVFNATIKKLSFTVTFTTTFKVNTGYHFGSLIWKDGIHVVRIPLSVRTEILPFFPHDY